VLPVPNSNRRGRVKPVLSGGLFEAALAPLRDLAQRRARTEFEMRSYLVVIDETIEARAALRYAARRASGTGGGVILLAVVPPAEFVQWGGVQAAMEEESKLRAEAMVLQASGAIVEEAGIEPTILVRFGEPEKAIADLLAERDDVAALVLGAAAEGGPGPLVSHFSGAVAGSLPCPLVIVPGRLGDEDLDRRS
jgi:nucleotide-binding universal stress UspA family protein